MTPREETRAYRLGYAMAPYLVLVVVVFAVAAVLGVIAR